MTWDHDRVEELLAGLALGGLDEEDLALAERARIEHLPGCEPCRDAFHGFRDVAGDLALAAPAVRPPDLVLASLRRTIRRSRRRERRWAPWAGAAAGVVLLGVVSAWSLGISSRIQDTEQRRTWLVDAVSAMGHPEAGVVPLSGPAEARISVLYVPGEERMFLVASGMQQPAQGVYQVWLVSDAGTVAATSFLPERGVVMTPLETGTGPVNEILVTHEDHEDVPVPAATPLAKAILTSG